MMSVDKAGSLNKHEEIGRFFVKAYLSATTMPRHSRIVAGVAVFLLVVGLSLPAPSAGAFAVRLRQGPPMHATISAQQHDRIALAAALFDEVAELAAAPTDGIYADYLTSRAFSYLLGALEAGRDFPPALSDCAEAIEGCTWLSTTVRAHVGRTLREAVQGHTPSHLALQIVASAAQRTAHQMSSDLVRAVGADGMGSLTDALDGIAAAIEGKTH